MKAGKKSIKNIDEYFSTVPEDIGIKLQQIRETIHKAAPKAEEVISYNMPSFRQKSVLVYFAAFKDHIGFFPTSKPIIVFKKELQPYKTSKGTIQFPLDKKIPIGLISKITKHRVTDVEERKINEKRKENK